MGGKHNKGCCGPCYLFRDDFDRADTTNLGSDWEECVGDWEIVDEELTTASGAGSVVVLKHMVGNPVGFLRGEVKFLDCAGAIYRMYVFYGSSGTACSGGSDYIVEIEVVDDDNGLIRILGGTSAQNAEVVVGGDTLEFQICVSDDELEVTTNGSVTYIDGWLVLCELAFTHYWFALGSNSSTQGYWLWAEYEDHYDHNVLCPKCRLPPCWPLEDKSLLGFHFLIEGISDGTQCSCPSTLEATIMIPEDTNPCASYLVSEVKELAHPGGGFLCATTDGIWTLHCDESGITISFALQPSVGTEVDWFMSWPPGTSIDDITVEDFPITDPGDGKSCDYRSATLTLTPIIGNGCCGAPS
jgi:hypothetical protein